MKGFGEIRSVTVLSPTGAECQNCWVRRACLILPCLHRLLCFIDVICREQCFAGAYLAVIQPAILRGGSGHCISVVPLLEEVCLFSGKPQQSHPQDAVVAVTLLLWSQVKWISHPALAKISPSFSSLKKKSVVHDFQTENRWDQCAESHCAVLWCLVSYP